ncbi:hypothetical protein F5Y15DRAFT_258949 [Xylariaceae sp. FL0016]|nr:hypothetical protein F5Y15DRAFT_258949 [Xylariaceae sp. FL0016]
MRLDVSTIGLLAYSVGFATAEDTRATVPATAISNAGAAGTTTAASIATNTAMTLEAFTTTPAVFEAEKPDMDIRWTTGSYYGAVNVSTIMLRKCNGDDIIASVTSPSQTVPTLAGSSDSDDSISSNAISSQGSKKREGEPPPVYLLQRGPDFVTLPLASGANFFSTNYNVALYFQFTWSNGSTQGNTYSPALAVYQPDGASTDAASAISAAEKDAVVTAGSPFKAETEVPTSTSATTTTGATSAATSAASTDAASASHANNKRLSTGAIVGIAVGCGVGGLLLISALLWFLCFRKRSAGGGRSKLGAHHDSGFASDGGTQAAMMGDKELHHASESTPHSTYDPTLSAGGHGGRSSSLDSPGVGEAAAAAAVGAGGYAPYSDHAPSPPPGAMPPLAQTQSHARNQSQTNLSTTSQGHSHSQSGVASRWQHLVEEGMTEDEIRQLEEEERHLDAAIEESGRSSSRR